MNVTTPNLLNTITETSAHICKGRTSIYALINAGKLVSVKDGKHRLITGESIKKYVENLVSDS